MAEKATPVYSTINCTGPGANSDSIDSDLSIFVSPEQAEELLTLDASLPGAPSWIQDANRIEIACAKVREYVTSLSGFGGRERVLRCNELRRTRGLLVAMDVGAAEIRQRPGFKTYGLRPKDSDERRHRYRLRQSAQVRYLSSGLGGETAREHRTTRGAAGRDGRWAGLYHLAGMKHPHPPLGLRPVPQLPNRTAHRPPHSQLSFQARKTKGPGWVVAQSISPTANRPRKVFLRLHNDPFTLPPPLSDKDEKAYETNMAKSAPSQTSDPELKRILRSLVKGLDTCVKGQEALIASQTSQSRTLVEHGEAIVKLAADVVALTARIDARASPADPPVHRPADIVPLGPPPTETLHAVAGRKEAAAWNILRGRGVKGRPMPYSRSKASRMLRNSYEIQNPQYQEAVTDLKWQHLRGIKKQPYGMGRRSACELLASSCEVPAICAALPKQSSIEKIDFDPLSPEKVKRNPPTTGLHETPDVTAHHLLSEDILRVFSSLENLAVLTKYQFLLPAADRAPLVDRIRSLKKRPTPTTRPSPTLGDYIATNGSQTEGDATMDNAEESDSIEKPGAASGRAPPSASDAGRWAQL
ncbi:hypothetical protein BDK51DRAFT_47290 [Blyttiomyces helicus]|uniref:Uncharacterized protein n=1 Tax=Blyttiomyces helicus TaxID=388810 RepID=A0A4P9WHG1_9FUNG|nr:hypothetical protein BDK51DRAFT_47290 [Blyttiomyces helicus]|eukprot:RKO89976.1 hypothetical protein BDK51DRAFT_47290 [Blyttiomyces helicus]